MSITIVTDSVSGLTLYASLTQIAAGGVEGDQWNNTLGAWQTTVSDSDAQVPLAEGAGRDTGSYVGGVTTTLGTYTGDVSVRVHDDQLSGLVQGTQLVYLDNGNQVDVGNIVASTSSPLIISDSRTWLLNDGEFGQANNIISIVEGSTVTCSFDFSNRSGLNPATDIQQLISASVKNVVLGTAPQITSSKLSDNRKAVHIGIQADVAGQYEMEARVMSTDGQTISMTGWLYVN